MNRNARLLSNLFHSSSFVQGCSSSSFFPARTGFSQNRSFLSSLRCSIEKLEKRAPQNFDNFTAVKVEPNVLVTLAGSSLHLAEISNDNAKVPDIEYKFEAPTKPPFHQNSKMFNLDGNLMIVGGKSRAKKEVNLHQIDPPAEGFLNVGQWESSVYLEEGVPLERFIAAKYGKNIAIMGETYYDEINDTATLMIFDSEKVEWHEWQLEKTDFMRDLSDSILFSDGKKLLLLSPNLQSTYDLHSFTLEEKEWKKETLSVDEKVSPPESRSSPAHTIMGKNRLVVFGGISFGSFRKDISVLDLDSFSWMNVKWDGPEPGARCGHEVVSLSDSSVLVFGGNTPSIGADDSLCVINFEEN